MLFFFSFTDFVFLAATSCQSMVEVFLAFLLNDVFSRMSGPTRRSTKGGWTEEEASALYNT